MFYLATSLSFLCICAEGSVEGAGENNKSYLAGKTQYDSLVQKSQMPDFGECWKASLSRTTEGCKRLTNTLTHQLAYDFTRCFYTELGHDIPKCTVEPETCKKNLESTILHGTYAMFFMHTRDMCFFLESQVWQETTQGTVNKLSSTSEKVVSHLQDADRIQQQIAAAQSETLRRQQSLLEGGNLLAEHVNSLEIGVKGMFTEFQLTYEQQMTALNHVFEKIAMLEKIFLTEYTGTQAVLLWIGSLVVTYIITSTKRTYPARFPMFLLTLAFSILELTLVNGLVSEALCQTLQTFNMLSSDKYAICQYRCVKLWRWTHLILAVTVLLHTALTFEDHDSKMYRAIIDVQRQLKLLKGSSVLPELIDKAKIVGDALEFEKRVSVDQGATTCVDLNAVNNKEEPTLSDEESSSDSDCASDETYEALSEISDSASSFVSNASDLCLVSADELINDNVKYADTLLHTVLKTNAAVFESPGGSRYNLRPRNHITSPPNSLLSETERQFTRCVKDLVRTRKRLSHTPQHYSNPNSLL